MNESPSSAMHAVLGVFFCTLVIIIIVICEQGGRTHNGTFVGGGHGR